MLNVRAGIGTRQSGETRTAPISPGKSHRRATCPDCHVTTSARAKVQGVTRVKNSVNTSNEKDLRLTLFIIGLTFYC